MKIDEIEHNSLEELEGNYWPEPESYPSPLVKKVYELRKKRISDFEPNDFRLMISQNEGLMYLIPCTLMLLESNILIDSMYYPGDLLMSVLNIAQNYWENDVETAKIFRTLLTRASKIIAESAEIYDESLRNEILDKVGNFLTDKSL